MALNSKKPPFGFNMEETLRRDNQHQYTHTHTDTDTDEHTGTHGHTDGYTYTDTDTHTHTHTDIKENKSKRLYLLAKPSVHQKLDAYAKSNGDTFNNLVHRLMEDFIKEHDL